MFSLVCWCVHALIGFEELVESLQSLVSGLECVVLKGKSMSGLKLQTQALQMVGVHRVQGTKHVHSLVARSKACDLSKCKG